MYEFLLLSALVLSLTVVPWWLFRRMKSVQRQATVTVQHRREKIPPAAPPIDETIGEEGGIAYQRRYEVNQSLIDADKEAAALPDITKTLSGNR
jgi:hypothetical protein